MIIKLNRYMSVRILDLNKIHLVFYGNKRGVRFNVGPDERVISLMTINPAGLTSRRHDPTFLDNYDYSRGKFNVPMFGFLDKDKNKSKVVNPSQSEVLLQSQGDQLPQLAYEYSFKQCETLDDHLPPLTYDSNVSQCAINPPGSAFLC